MSDFKDRIVTEWKPEFVVSSGSLLLDNSPALSGFKGIPSGTVAHYFSPQEGSFKTTMALQGLINIQKMGHKVAFVDAEASLMDINWVRGIGIDTEKNWALTIPEDGEEAFSMVEYFIKEGYKGIIVDSIDACQPSSILTSEYGDAHIGNHAKLVTAFVRRLKSLVMKYNVIVWLVNQEKINMTVMGARGHKPTGGAAIMFYSKLNIEMKRTESERASVDKALIPLTLAVKRSKLGTSYVDIETFAIQGKGIDKGGELIGIAKEKALIKKAGSWWSDADGVTIGQGNDAARAWCIENEKLIC